MSAETGFRVGDMVRFLYGTGKVTGTVKEDRGPIGLKGRRLYLVDFSPEPSYSSQIELPAELMEPSPTWAILRLGRSVPSIEQSHNVTTVTDNPAPGIDFTLKFGEPFSDDLYSCEVSANQDVRYRILKKTKGSVRLAVEDPLPERVKIICFEQ